MGLLAGAKMCVVAASKWVGLVDERHALMTSDTEVPFRPPKDNYPEQDKLIVNSDTSGVIRLDANLSHRVLRSTVRRMSIVKGA
jgi:hypothetical protein